MSARVFKSISPSDISITPFKSYKEWSITDKTSGSFGLHVQEGVFNSGSLNLGDGSFDLTPFPTNSVKLITDVQISSSFKSIIHDSIKHLYYNSPDDPFRRFGGTNIFTESREIHDRIIVLSIPQKMFGEEIKKNSITLIDSGSGDKIIITDDGNGNLIDTAIPSGSIPSNFIDVKTLVGYWGFNDGYTKKTRRSTGFTTRDESRFRKHGVTQNVNFNPGIYGTDATFLVTGSIRIPHYDEINFKRNENFGISMELTIPPSQSLTETGSNDILIKWGRGTETKTIKNVTQILDTDVFGGYPYAVRVYNQSYPVAGDRGKIEVSRWDGNNKTIVTSSAALNDSQPHHIVFNKTGSILQLFVDDAQQGSDVTDNSVRGDTHNNSDLWVGKRGDNKYGFSGSVDEVRMYNNGFTTTEVTNASSSKANNNFVGNIIYEHGLLIITNPLQKYDTVALGSGNTGFNLTFKSTTTIHEHEYVCRILESQLNNTMNPTIRINNDIKADLIQDFATGSAFNPYVTTIGLYNDSGELLAIGKPASAVRKIDSADMTFIIRIDL